MNFKLMRQNIKVATFKDEFDVYLKSHPWSTVRANAIPAQINTEDISLRRAVIIESQIKNSTRHITSIATDTEYHSLNKNTYPYFQKTYAYIEDFATEIGGQLTRAMIVNLKPGTKVLPHIDAGNYYINKDRCHIPISTRGSLNICDGERQIYEEGELWWFDNKKTHEAENTSDEERVHIIFDVLMKKRNLLTRCRDYLEKRLAMVLQS